VQPSVTVTRVEDLIVIMSKFELHLTVEVYVEGEDTSHLLLVIWKTCF
jgi:hypothetical protein